MSKRQLPIALKEEDTRQQYTSHSDTDYWCDVTLSTDSLMESIIRTGAVQTMISSFGALLS